MDRILIDNIHSSMNEKASNRLDCSKTFEPKKPKEGEQLNLPNIPKVPLKERAYLNSPTSQKGFAGENIALAFILSLGHPATLSSPGSPYDIIFETSQGFKKVQVKARYLNVSNIKFEFSRNAFLRHGKQKLDYAEEDFDISCTVNLTDRKVLFFPGVQKRIRLTRAQFMHKNAELNSWSNTLEQLGIKQGGLL